MRSIPFLLQLVALVGCGSGLVEDEIEGYRRLSGSLKVGGDGQRTLHFEPQPGETAMLLTSQSEGDARTHVIGVDVEGVAIFDAVTEATGVNATTNAGYLSPVATLNWPRSGREVLGPIDVAVGNVATNDTYTNGRLELTALFKRDADLARGSVRVVLVYAGGTDGDAELVQAVQEALGLWRVLYGRVGLAVDVVDEVTWPDGDLAAPVYGTDEAWTQIAEAFGPFVLPVVIAPQIADLEDVLGIAGDIPGPLVATPRTGVLLSALDAAGPDGVFDALDTRLLGETLAHETGHFLGLFHPVETEWDRWDSLDDTDECKTESKCIEALEGLLMFPFPVCNFTSCVAQEVLTDEQAEVINRYTGVD